MEILAISGGDLASGQTLALDRFALELTGRNRPRALFIPTASGDSRAYCRVFHDVYANRLGCETDELMLSLPADRRAAAEKLAAADLVYVGGGSTLRLMTNWRRWGIDLLLEALVDQPKVFTGLSAGGIVWHAAGHSDSRKTLSGDHIRVRALGWVPGVYCPHFDSEQREASLRAMLTKHREGGWGCDDLTALWYRRDGTVQVKAASPSARVHRFQPSDAGLDSLVFGDGDQIP